MRREPLVTVWPDRNIYGWEGGAAELEDLVGCPVVGVREALGAEHTTDAHMWPAWIEGPTGGVDEVIPRIKKKARTAVENAGARILFGLVVYDVDDKETHRGSGVARESWISEVVEKLAVLPWREGMGVYLTKGGMRLLWELPEPLGIDAYLSFMRLFRAELARHGIEADALEDWTRCYRLPRVMRDGRRQERDSDLEGLGVLTWKPPAGALNGPTKAGDAGTGKFAGIGAVRTAKLPYRTPEKITKNRNMELTRSAGMMRRAGLDPDAILAALRVVNEDRCDPPLGDEELVHIAESAGSWEPGRGARREPEPSESPEQGEGEDGDADPEDDNAGEGPEDAEIVPGRLVARAPAPALASAGPRFLIDSDAHIAEHVLGEIETEGEALIHDRGLLWTYRPDLGIWEILPAHVVQRVVLSFDQEWIAVGDKVKPFKAGARVMRDILRVVEVARAAPGWFDQEVPGLAFRNGFATVGEKGVELRELSPAWRATCAIPMDYSGHGKPRRFLAFLASCFEGDPDAAEKIAVLQEFTGACLLGRATAFQRGVILVGGGSNGKSTFQKIVSALFQGRMITAIPPQEMEQEYRRAMLAASRLNVVNELPEADILESGPVKAAISGDLMNGRSIREAPFEFYPRAGHLYSANTLPNVRDLTEGFFRRWILIEWNQSFAKGAKDPNLADRIVAEELDAVAAWALEGAVRLEREREYSEPESSLNAVREWRESADQVSAFLMARCIWPALDGTDPYTGATELYNDYARWAQANGHLKVTSTKFGRRLRTLGVEPTRMKNGMGYRIERKRMEAVTGTGLGTGGGSGRFGG
jgi:P4 family phage/plasmid primase-like protien